MMEALTYEKEYKIQVNEIGVDGRLNPHSLFNYFQDIASEHAVKLRFGKDDLMKENRFWVLSRMAADINIWSEWEDKLIIKTWPRGTDKVFALRDFSVYYPDGRHIASATSSWLVVDRTTRRVQRPDSLLTHLNADMPVEKSLGRNAEKLGPVDENYQESRPFRVKVSDLDINLHTNNVVYLEWITDSYDLEFRMSYVPVTLEINYMAESRWDDELKVRKSEDKNHPLLFSHSVFRESDNTELCRARIGWKNCRL
jgi:medium-chain acyl-[acyl-carrier-protein] hydrolase